MKKIYNKSQRMYQHAITVDGVQKIISIKSKESKEICDEVADVWLKSPEFELLVDSNEIEAKDTEIAKLKAELEKKSDKSSDGEKEALIKEAKELGLNGLGNAKIETIKAKIEAKKTKKSEDVVA